MSDGTRVIAENASFVAFVPYAALSPFHVWFFPKHHSAYFGDATDNQLADLASVLRGVLLRLSVGLEDPDYNFVIRSLSPQEGALKYFHWYISLIPRVTKSAGFELGTGMFINTALPRGERRVPEGRRAAGLSRISGRALPGLAAWFTGARRRRP